MAPSFPTSAALRLIAGLLTALVLVHPALAQETRYLATETNLTTEAGMNIGRVAPGTPLKVLGHGDGRVEVEISGWSPEGGERYLFTAIGQRILVARLSDTSLPFAETAAEQEDDYESLWYNVYLTGWLPEANITDNVGQVWQAGSELFHQRCTRCHALHRPYEFTANQWPSILKIMTVRAGLKGADRALVVQYLQTHAKDGPAAGDGSDDDTGPAPIQGDAALAEAGAGAYDDNGCAGCHGDDATTPADITYPWLAGQSADYVFKQLSDFQSGDRANDPDEMMRGAVEDLSEADMRAIAWWLGSLGSQQ